MDTQTIRIQDIRSADESVCAFPHVDAAEALRRPARPRAQCANRRPARPRFRPHQLCLPHTQAHAADAHSVPTAPGLRPAIRPGPRVSSAGDRVRDEHDRGLSQRCGRLPAAADNAPDRPLCGPVRLRPLLAAHPIRPGRGVRDHRRGWCPVDLPPPWAITWLGGRQVRPHRHGIDGHRHGLSVASVVGGVAPHGCRGGVAEAGDVLQRSQWHADDSEHSGRGQPDTAAA
mmetsp:Transcript_30407/g.75491  ORF Transcript_30407/g.75491 Transcript_30407/m.75491 type:complete len:230 (+) Transcript_30407:607-1296(+)